MENTKQKKVMGVGYYMPPEIKAIYIIAEKGFLYVINTSGSTTGQFTNDDKGDF